MKVKLLTFLNPTLMEVSDQIQPMKSSHYLLDGWVRTGLDTVTGRKVPAPEENRIPIFQPVASQFTD
jgi:hypothetical protein